MSEDPLRRAVGLARRVPGYRFVRRRAVPRIRRSAAARALVDPHLLDGVSRVSGAGHRCRAWPTAGRSRRGAITGDLGQPRRIRRWYR